MAQENGDRCSSFAANRRNTTLGGKRYLRNIHAHFHTPSNGPTTTSYPEILELCEKAERISLILRQSRATFTVSLAPKDQIIDQPEDSKLELVAVEGQSSSISPKVRHTVFGGLVKTTSFPGEEDVVMTLEKPIVVGYYA